MSHTGTSLSIKNVSIKIGQKPICDHIDLTFSSGQIWGILGRNGVGKTTLLHSLAGLRPIQSGDIFINDTSIDLLNRKHLAQQLGVLLQHTEDPFPATVMETVLCGRHPHIANWQWENKQDQDIALKALQTVEMSDMANRLVNQLSGGERQRVAIAALLTQQTDILILDEPNTHLDLNYQIKLLGEMTQYVKEKQGIIIMSLHDINLAHHFCDHILLMNENTTILSGTRDEILTESNLQLAYSCKINKLVDGDNVFFSAKYS